VEQDVQSDETVVEDGIQGELDATEPEQEPEELGAPSLSAAIEALLLLADEPMSIVSLAQATRQTTDEVDSTVRALALEYDEAVRGFELREIAGGWRYYTRAECSPLVERFVLDGQQARLTQASLETLAVIAYRQPVTRGRVSAVRGVNVDGVIRTLVARGLIEEAGHEQESQAILYRTTSTFLERLGIASLEDLPPLAEHLPDLADLEDVLDSVAFGD
jgi:segregation and condensation protein B